MPRCHYGVWRRLSANWESIGTRGNQRRHGQSSCSIAKRLNNLAVRLGELGRWQAALAPAEEALTLRRGLLEDGVAVDYLVGSSTNNCALLYCQLGRYREAIHAAGEESVAIYRNVGLEREGDLASALNTLGLAKSRTDDVAARWRRGKSAPIYGDILPRITRTSRPRLPKCSRTWQTRSRLPATSTLPSRLERSGRRIRPPRCRPGCSLRRRPLCGPPQPSAADYAANRAEEAAPVISEAVQLRRSLADRYPDLYTDELARSLTTMARVWFALEDLEGSSQLAQEAVAIRDAAGWSPAVPRRVV